jgi:hypothetical protein
LILISKLIPRHAECFFDDLISIRHDSEIFEIMATQSDGLRKNVSKHDAARLYYHPNIQAKINGATMVASLSTMNFGVLISSLPQVIFSFGTAPE